jgi:hypothetical protein
VVGDGLCQRLLDPLGKAFRLVRQRGRAFREPFVCRLPDSVQREHDADDPRCVVDHPFHQRKPISGAEERQDTGRCESTPREGCVFDLLMRELIGVMAESLLPLRKQPRRT